MLAKNSNLICVLDIDADSGSIDEAVAAASPFAHTVVMDTAELGEVLATRCGDHDVVWVLTLGPENRVPADDNAALARFTAFEALPGCTYGFHVCHMTSDGTGYAEGFELQYCLTAWERDASGSGRFRETPTLVRVPTTLRLQHWGGEVTVSAQARPWRDRPSDQPVLQPAKARNKPSGPVKVRVSVEAGLRIEPTKPASRPTPFDEIVRHSASPLNVPEEERGLLPPGVTHRLAAVSSSYHMFAPPMAQNIEVVSRLLASMQIEPGGIFSLDRAIGPITEERGFTEGRVIAGGQVSSDIGGGLCAVSTLIFRAALLAGFPFIRWNPHILRLPFYEQAGWPAGIDATYFQPNDPSQKLVDLRFQNDTPWACLIQLTARQKLITAEIFGGAIDYDVEIDGPIVTGRRAARLIERQATWLKPGKRKKVQEPQDGIDVEFWRIVRNGDRVVSERAFASGYRPEHGIVYVGAARDPAEASPTD